MEKFLDENLSTCAVDFEELKVVLQSATTHVFGYKKRIQNDCFNGQDEEIQHLLNDKKLDRHPLRRRIRELKNNWFRQRAEEAERTTPRKRISESSTPL